MYVVAEAGATMVCVWAPPSDQDENAYDEPPRVCGETALDGVRGADDHGAGERRRGLCRPDDELEPGGLEANVSTTVCGSSLRISVSVRPPASVAVRRSSRYEGYSWSGAVNEPPATPENVWIVCW